MAKVTFHLASLLTVALATSGLIGCADVHQNPAASTVAGLPDPARPAGAQRNGDVAPGAAVDATSVAFGTSRSPQ